MSKYPSDIGFSPAVKAIQVEKGSRDSYAKMEQRGGWTTGITPELETFISQLDMFYLGTSNADGQPYIQYRGGPQGFLRTVDSKTLGFADFGGNQQYISLGNLSENPKAFIFLMDYTNSRRIKLWGNAHVVEDDSQLLESLRYPEYKARVERAILFRIEAWDVNCPQHIHKRFSQQQVAPVIEELRASIGELEEQLRLAKEDNAVLRAKCRDARSS